MERYAIIMAGGTGSRMNQSLPKQFILVDGKPILMHTISAFHNFSSSVRIILVLPAMELNRWNRLCEQHLFTIPHQCVSGGETRSASVRNGLDAITSHKGLVAIHDGVRPLVSGEIIEESFMVAAKSGSAIATVKLKDSIRKINNHGTMSLNRDEYRLVQTPQTFNVSLIKHAYQKVEKEYSDDATVAEMAGYPIYLIEGDYRNIKITTQEDLKIAEALLQSKRAISAKED